MDKAGNQSRPNVCHAITIAILFMKEKTTGGDQAGEARQPIDKAPGSALVVAAVDLTSVPLSDVA